MMTLLAFMIGCSIGAVSGWHLGAMREIRAMHRNRREIRELLELKRRGPRGV